MAKPLTAIVLFSAFTVCVTGSGRSVSSLGQSPCLQHEVWVGHALERMETVKAGMTRDDLLKVFTTEGGISTGLQRTYVSRDCAYFKVDAEFQAVGRPDRDSNGRVTLQEDARDIIIKISRPYLQFSVTD